MTIRAILREKGGEVAHVSPGDSIADVVAMLNERRIGAVLVCEGGRPVGVVSERDVVRGLHQRGATVLTETAAAVMTAPVITIGEGESVSSAMELMTDRRIRHLPVESNGRLVGIVSIGDLVKRRIEQAELEAMALKDYIATA